MTRILLVGTVHEEQGLATISALHAILEHARPEVIFLEIPSAVFPSYDDGTRSNLESSAARRYREDNDVALVPVDLATPDESFFRDCKYLDRRIATTSPTYCRLIDQNSHDIATYGFPYLNSHQCSKAWSDIYEAMHTGIQRLSHDSRLSEIFAVWKHTNSLRDRAMLRSIDEYYLRRPFENGMLLVGAAHLQSISEKSREGRGGGTPRITPIPFGALNAQQ